jgi:hypothetical protein
MQCACVHVRSTVGACVECCCTAVVAVIGCTQAVHMVSSGSNAHTDTEVLIDAVCVHYT